MAHNAYTFRYRVRTWRTYNQALISRDGITFWIDETAPTAWHNTQVRIGTGAPRIYSNTVIHRAVLVKTIYRLSLHAAQGFVPSMMTLTRLDLPGPNYSTIYQRQGPLTDQSVHLPLTGLAFRFWNYATRPAKQLILITCFK